MRLQLRSLLVLIGVLLSAGIAYASTGTIDSVHKYAWSNVGGWMNFAPTMGGVTVSDSALTGYAWSANDGWINFAPTSGGVENDGQGNLSGFAWDETLGWLDFSGVTIDSSGVFHGQATGATQTLTFDCTSCEVSTTWRPAVSASPAPESGGGGRSGSTVVNNEDTSPSTGPEAPNAVGVNPPNGAIPPAADGVHAGTGAPRATTSQPASSSVGLPTSADNSITHSSHRFIEVAGVFFLILIVLFVLWLR